MTPAPAALGIGRRGVEGGPAAAGDPGFHPTVRVGGADHLQMRDRIINAALESGDHARRECPACAASRPSPTRNIRNGLSCARTENSPADRPPRMAAVPACSRNRGAGDVPVWRAFSVSKTAPAVISRASRGMRAIERGKLKQIFAARAAQRFGRRLDFGGFVFEKAVNGIKQTAGAVGRLDGERSAAARAKPRAH